MKLGSECKERLIARGGNQLLESRIKRWAKLEVKMIAKMDIDVKMYSSPAIAQTSSFQHYSFEYFI